MFACQSCGQEVSNKSSRCRACFAKKSAHYKIQILGLVALVLVAIPPLMITVKGPLPAPPTPQSRPANDFNDMIANLTLDYDWHKGGFNDVFLADFKITNKNAFPVRDVMIFCMVGSASGTALGEMKGTIYDIVPAHQTKKFRKFNMGLINSQSTSAQCRIVGAHQKDGS